MPFHTSDGPLAPDDNSKSGRSVRLLDSRQFGHPPAQKVSDYLFTFEVSGQSKIVPISAILCAQSTNFTSHLHETSEKCHPCPLSRACSFDHSSYYKTSNHEDLESVLLLPESNPDASTADITKLLDKSTLHQSKHSEMTSRQIRRILRKWARRDHRFATECQQREATNPFPGIDLNVGWNRARCELEMHFDHLFGSVEERMRIKEDFTRFSFARQQDALLLKEDVCAGIERIFVGAARGISLWSRQPGSWWGARERLLTSRHGELFEDAQKMVESIKRGVNLWSEKTIDQRSGTSSMKRSLLASVIDSPGETTTEETQSESLFVSSKRVKSGQGKSEEVMSEAWRARRRLQEKKAGRWTDGTLRMERLWLAFHWVCNGEDPTAMAWRH